MGVCLDEGQEQEGWGRDTWTPEVACCWKLLRRGLIGSQGPEWARVHSIPVTG